MPRVFQENDEVLVGYDLGNPDVELDLTSDPWNLVAEKQARAIIGRDVIHPGTFAPEGGRREVVTGDSLMFVGGVRSWGRNQYGQLADGTTANKSSFVSATGMDDAIAIDGGLGFTIMLKSDGTVWGIGLNDVGQLGDGSTTNRTSFVQTSGLTGITAISVGQAHALALKSDGTVWAWGDNHYGQLGDNTTTNRSTPVQVLTALLANLTGVSAISAGYYYSLALLGTGHLKGWGENDYGQIGDATTTERHSAYDVSGTTHFSAISAGGYHSVGLQVSTGQIFTWGFNTAGQLGHGDTSDHTSPSAIDDASSFVSISAGASNTFALKSDGTAWGCGANTYGCVGDGTNTQRNSLVQLTSLSDIVSIDGGYFHALALKSDGTVWAWGYNYYGQLGDGTTTNRWTPVQASGIVNAESVAANYSSSFADGEQSGAILDTSGSQMAGRQGRFNNSMLSDFVVTGYSGTTTTLKKLVAPYAWPSGVVGATIVRNGDGRFGLQEARTITGISTVTETDDTITWNGEFGSAWKMGDKFSIIYTESFDKRGIWLTNGRKFWLLQANVCTLYLDLGADSYLGERWNVARIASGCFMFTNPKYPPRVIRLDSPVETGTSGNDTIAGLLAPCNPDPYSEQIAPSWDMAVAAGTTGAMSAGVYRVAVRAVNLITGAESKVLYAKIASTIATDQWVDNLTVLANAALRVGDNGSDGLPGFGVGSVIPVDPKWTHIEIYRTTVGGSIYYLEAQVEVKGRSSESWDWHKTGALVAAVPRYGPPIGAMSDLSIIGQTALTTADRLAGNPPPICEQACSLNGVTICAGAADSAVVDPQFPAYPIADFKAAYTQSTRTLTLSTEVIGSWLYGGIAATTGGTYTAGTNTLTKAGCGLFTAGSTSAGDPVVILAPAQLAGIRYIATRVDDDTVTLAAVTGLTAPIDATATVAFFRAGTIGGGAIRRCGITTSDKVVIEAGSGGAGSIVLGTYDIESLTSGRELVLATDASPTGDVATIRCYILRQVTVPWPKVLSDEEIWYSRTDKFSPESFLLRTLTLSRDGDEFRAMVAVGNYVAVVMAKNIHLLYWDASTGDLLRDTVSVGGDGTPWPKSVVSLEHVAIWATPTGPRAMVVSNDADSDGHRGRIGPLGKGEMRAWFEEAFTNGEEIDAGIDTVNACVRFRRAINSNTFQVAQYSMRTGKWTLLDDDNGVGYSLSRYADSSPADADVMYSVTNEGRVFEVNNYDLDDRYSGATMQAVTSVAGGYTVTTTSITKTGAFTTAMEGDVVRFRSATAAVDGVARVIRTATANAITFDALTGLAIGDEFIVGAVRFKAKFAPLKYSSDSSVKTLHALRVRAAPGIRSTAWATPATGQITVRAYEEYSETAGDDNDREVKILQGSESGMNSEDRESAVEAQSAAVEVEIEHVEARVDFKLTSVEAIVRDDAVTLADADTA